MAEPLLPAMLSEDLALLNVALEEGGRIDVAAGKLPPRTVPGLMPVESLTPRAIKRRA